MGESVNRRKIVLLLVLVILLTRKYRAVSIGVGIGIGIGIDSRIDPDSDTDTVPDKVLIFPSPVACLGTWSLVLVIDGGRVTDVRFPLAIDCS